MDFKKEPSLAEFAKIFDSYVKVDRWYPSSKTCNCCGYKMGDMDLSIREWDCPDCNTHHDRDLNAAKNILDEGLRDLYSFTSDELADYRRGEEVRHATMDAFFCEAFRLSCL